MRNTIFLVLIIFASVSNAFGQSVFVVGGEGYARQCYDNARNSVLWKIASIQDTSNCTYALDNVSLNLRDRTATFINRGVIYSASKEYDLALSDYERALGMMSDVGVAYLNKGNIMFMIREFDDAIEQYNLAMKYEKTKLHVVYLNRGMAYENSGKADLAYNDYTEALKILPEWHEATKRMDRLLLRYPNLNQAG
ncbi:MAG: tetratricopeptide repeat protein [Arenicellaceae bacterium]|nr:tetratricopeptide repeat protein [Arenicellaceae bacterium]